MNPCVSYRGALAVYVLGAIDPAERAELERHLADCPACRDELAGLAGLPALLGRVDEGQLAHVAGPPPELLDSLLARAAGTRRGPSWRRWPALAAAAALLIGFAFVLGGLLVGGGGDHDQAAGPRSTAEATVSPAAAEQVAATDPKTGVAARIQMTPEEWGMSLSLWVDHAPGGIPCHLEVVDQDGARDTAASWRIEDEGYGAYSGSTMISRGRVQCFELVTADGRVLVTIPV